MLTFTGLETASLRLRTRQHGALNYLRWFTQEDAYFIIIIIFFFFFVAAAFDCRQRAEAYQGSRSSSEEA
jgi:hypothetical protein